jgi:Spy/CpxP family protein refolding chaperone
MRRATAVAAVSGIFLAGFVTGAVSFGVYAVRHLRQPGWLFSSGSRMMAAELRRELDLTPEQGKQVDAILAQTRTDVMAVRHQLTAELKTILERSRQRIEAILTPDQRQKFEALRRRHRERRHHWLIPRHLAHGDLSSSPPPASSDH